MLVSCFNGEWIQLFEGALLYSPIINFISGDFKLICYQVVSPYDITYHDHKRRDYESKSKKIEVRQRQFDTKKQVYKNFLIPILAEVGAETTLPQIKNSIANKISIWDDSIGTIQQYETITRKAS